MYSELIYTRCGEGIDLMRGRNPIKSSGFKVYSCSENITDSGIADIPLLYATAQSKESYADPGFMDDAYLFFVPDIGKRIMMDFHPIPFDRGATGDYSHRPGNFINQIFIGEFNDRYPYELFGNDLVWDAKKRGEAFYYENAPSPLAQRENLDITNGNINFDDISEFVSNGRQEVLKKAIAFIISQYSLPAEKRKYLIVKDENSMAIELWIAAIESAFSPRMTSGLSFATRLDKFVSTNRYTVNLNGEYQTQINLQSSTQKLRFKAMIIGVDDRDRTNSAAVKPLANAPYAVLDGKTKSLSINVEATDPYYELITSYNIDHEQFCRRFMQMIDLAFPSKEVTTLYSAFSGLSKYRVSKEPRALISALNILSQFKLIKSADLKHLYDEIKLEIPAIMQKDPVSAFSVMGWLERIANILGDGSLHECFREAVCQAYAESIFTKPQSDITKKLHSEVGKSVFAQIAEEYLVSKVTADYYTSSVQKYNTVDWICFTEFYTDALKSLHVSCSETFGVYLSSSIYTLYSANDLQNAKRVASLYATTNQNNTVTVLLSVAKQASDQSYIRFLIQLICEIAPDIVASNNAMESFYNNLKTYNLNGYFSVVLEYKARKMVSSYEIEKFLDWLLTNKETFNIDLSTTFVLIDRKISILDTNANGLATKIQKNRPKGVSCINSAHVYSLIAMSDRRLTNMLDNIIVDVVSQGFPSIENDEYVKRLVKVLFDERLPKNVFATIVSASSKSYYYSVRIVEETMKYVGTRHGSIVGVFFESALNADSKILTDAIIGVLVEIKQFEKTLSAIKGTINSQIVQQYFSSVELKAKELHDQKKGPSLFGRLFSRSSTNDSNAK